MDNMKFRIDHKILSAYPKVKIGVLVGREINVEEQNPELEEYKKKVALEAIEKIGTGPVTQHLFIKSWREMYRSFGTKPGDYRPSAEALLRRVRKRKALPCINNVVDIYNALSIKHLIPMGVFDIDRTQGMITLRLSGGGESFQPLGAAPPEETYENEPVYADGIRILTRRWNYRDCDATKITLKTRSLAIFVDGSREIPRRNVEDALQEMKALLREHCGGYYHSGIADANNPSISLLPVIHGRL
jgi:DNA/RNA-binding domain of Phe-tRNA-synthetase-like protein